MEIIHKLPYATNALEPYLSEKIVDLHYNGHHKTYIQKTIELAASAGIDLDLERTILHAYKNKMDALFNNAAQAYNHDLYWNSLSIEKNKPQDQLYDLIISQYGDVAKIEYIIKSVCMNHFASGWCWIVYHNNSIEIMSTSNAYTPIIDNKQILLTIDLWEHSYYIDYYNKKIDYVENMIKILDWKNALKKLFCILQ